MESGLTSIGSHSFQNCSNLNNIDVNENNSYFSSLDGVLYNKDKTKIIKCPEKKEEVIIPDSVIEIGENAFYLCNQLRNIELPNSVTIIGNYAFWNSSLRKVELSENITSIGDYAFAYTRSLSNIEIPRSVTYIGKSAFYLCASFTDIKIPDNITNIESHTFWTCSSLKSIDIPSTITNIGEYAFDNCNKLTTINYHGTEEEFNSITIGENNDPFTNATVNYITD